MLLAATITIIGAILIYLASSHQKLVFRKLPSRPLRISGFLLAGLSFIIFRQSYGPATALFAEMTILMLVWTLAPLLIVYFRTAN